MLRSLRLCIFMGLFLLFVMSGTSPADINGITHQEDSVTARIEAGYRAFSVHGTPQRAREYDSLEAGPTLNLDFQGGQAGRNFTFEGRFLNDKDYSLDADLNLHSQLRFLLRTARLFHNLDHIPYVGDEAPLDSVYLGNPQPDRHDYTDSDPGDTYGLRIDETEASVRVKLPDYPAHLNLKYWRWEKKGEQQLRYVVENCATSCHMTSKTRPVDRVTEEFSGSVNAHLGFFDLIFEQVVRTFREKSATPYDEFDSHWLRSSSPNKYYQHNENPDATFTQSTLKAHTTLGGGFVANASFSLGKRENESDLFDVAPVKAETDFRKFASDVTYSPSANWTYNFRYRLLDIDQRNSNQTVANGATYVTSFFPVFTISPRSFPYEVRDSISLERAFYEASVAYRPTPRMTLKADYRREDIHRSNTGGPVAHSSLTVDPVVIDPNWELPENETIQKYRLSYNSRHLPKNALKLNAWYQYQTSDDPAYNTSIEKGHTAFLSATYRPGVFWGTTASLKVQKSSNDGFQHFQFAGNPSVRYDFQQDRDQEQQNASLGFWLNPVEALAFDLNYGFLRSHISQDLLFGNGPPYTIEDDSVDYRQKVHTITLGTTWQATEVLSCRLEGYHIRSDASYSPNFPSTLVVNASSDDLHDISKIEIQQNGLRGRLDWRFDKQLTAGLEASFDDYDDQNGDVFDGSAQTYLASLSYRW